MREGKANRHGGNCKRCGQWVVEGDGQLVRGEANGGWTWLVEHVGPCPPATNGRSSEQRAFDARAAEPAEPLPHGDHRVAAEWAAYHQLRGLRTEHPLTIEQLDDVLDGADIEAMDVAVAQGCEAILRSASVHDPVEW